MKDITRVSLPSQLLG